MPHEVRSKVLGMAGKGSALIIEMLWSSSPYLPAHNGGQKYKEPLGFHLEPTGCSKAMIFSVGFAALVVFRALGGCVF